MPSRARFTTFVASLSVVALLVVTMARCSTTPPIPGGTGKDWPVYGGSPDSIHYSTLSQINRQNVHTLRAAWTFDTSDAFPQSEMQCNPLIVDGVLYATTPKVNVVALDAATGRLLWRFDPHEGRKVLGTFRNRGVTRWSDGKDARLFVAVRQFLYALNTADGKPVRSFGDSGRIDLRDNLRPGERQMISLTTPGVIYKDLLIIGSINSEGLPTPPGDIRAFDVRTGRLRWAFHTIPRAGEFGYDTWPKDAWKWIGGANNWAGMSLDEKRGLVFAPTGSAAYDFYGANRLGDNLFANSLVVLKADTGERVWHFQTVRHDIWDRDLPAPPSLISVTREGRTVDAVSQTTKSGYVYLFDRDSGKPLFPVEYRRAPSSELEGEVTADTQPFPLRPAPFARQLLTADMLTRRTPAAQADALTRFQKVRSAGQFVPGSRAGTMIFPGYDGGAEWGGTAFDPETSLLYVNANEMAWILTMVEAPPPAKNVSGKDLYQRECSMCHGADLGGTPPQFPSLKRVSDRYTDSELTTMLSQASGRMPSFERLGNQANQAIVRFITTGEDLAVTSAESSTPPLKYQSDGYKKFLDPEGYPAIAPPWGTLNALNLATGEYAWKIPFGEYPALAEQGLKDTGSENYGGPVVTAGGLIFIGATSYDRKMHAFDKTNGKLLWEATLPAGGNATPATYEVNGRQFVVIAAGGGKSKDPSGGSYVAYSLPD